MPRKAVFEAGIFHFHAVIDDALRLWVDNQLLIDEWHDGSARQVDATLALIQGPHDLRVEYYENTGTAIARVWWPKQQSKKSLPGRVKYWANTQLSGSPILIRDDKAVEFDFGAGSPAPGIGGDGFSARWTRTFNLEPATYRISARADDGIRIFVNGIKVLERWSDGVDTEWKTVDLPLAGQIQIVVQYYENTGNALCSLLCSDWLPLPQRHQQ